MFLSTAFTTRDDCWNNENRHGSRLTVGGNSTRSTMRNVDTMLASSTRTPRGSNLGDGQRSCYAAGSLQQDQSKIIYIGYLPLRPSGGSSEVRSASLGLVTADRFQTPLPLIDYLLHYGLQDVARKLPRSCNHWCLCSSISSVWLRQWRLCRHHQRRFLQVAIRIPLVYDDWDDCRSL
jgi:hypothetical protein